MAGSIFGVLLIKLIEKITQLSMLLFYIFALYCDSNLALKGSMAKPPLCCWPLILCAAIL